MALLCLLFIRNIGTANANPVMPPGVCGMGTLVNAKVTYVNRKGTVYSAIPGRYNFKSKTTDVTIVLNKTGGQAKTIVNIYVDNRRSATMKFENGFYKRKTTRVLKNVKGKNIKIEIVNQSVTNKIDYHILCTGILQTDEICPKTILNKNGTVLAVAPGTYTVKPLCNDLKITLKKTGGKAETQVNVYVNGRYRRTNMMKFSAGNYQRTLSTTVKNVRGQKVKIDIVNQSVLNDFRYNIKGVQAN